jgi:hypothetical protein
MNLLRLNTEYKMRKKAFHNPTQANMALKSKSKSSDMEYITEKKIKKIILICLIHNLSYIPCVLFNSIDN